MHKNTHAVLWLAAGLSLGLGGCGGEEPGAIELRLVGANGRPVRAAFSDLQTLNFRAITADHRQVYSATVAVSAGQLPDFDPSALEGARLWVRGYNPQSELRALGWSTPLQLSAGWRRVVLHPIGELRVTVDRVTTAQTRPQALRIGGLGFGVPSSGQVLLVGGRTPFGGPAHWERFDPRTERFSPVDKPPACPDDIRSGALRAGGTTDDLLLVGPRVWCQLRLDAQLKRTEVTSGATAGASVAVVNASGALERVAGPEGVPLQRAVAVGAGLLAATPTGEVYRRTGTVWAQDPDVLDFAQVRSGVFLLRKGGVLRRVGDTADYSALPLKAATRLVGVGADLVAFGGDQPLLLHPDANGRLAGDPQAVGLLDGLKIDQRTGAALVSIPARAPRPAELLMVGGEQPAPDEVINTNPPALIMMSAPR